MRYAMSDERWAMNHMHNFQQFSISIAITFTCSVDLSYKIIQNVKLTNIRKQNANGERERKREWKVYNK